MGDDVDRFADAMDSDGEVTISRGGNVTGKPDTPDGPENGPPGPPDDDDVPPDEPSEPAPKGRAHGGWLS